MQILTVEGINYKVRDGKIFTHCDKVGRLIHVASYDGNRTALEAIKEYKKVSGQNPWLV
jgi:hypothetical protein